MNDQREDKTIKGAEDRQRIFVDAALYEEFDLGQLDDDGLYEFLSGSGTADAYCTDCKRMSTFHFSAPYVAPGEKQAAPRLNGSISRTGTCGRGGIGLMTRSGCQGLFLVSFYRSHDVLIKIGQYPSRRTCDFGLLDPVFNRELEDDLRKELGAAVGLRAHGVGIGSFVYLRRILESLIEEAHQLASDAKDEWDEGLYIKARVPERIKLLRAFLPSRLVETAELYSILSKGLHSLSEKECKQHFDLVFQSILMILRERDENKRHHQMVSELGRRKDELVSQEAQS